MSTFAEVVLEVHEALDAAAVPHAFGGALALGLYADPRATADVDINVFAPTVDARPVDAALGALGYSRPLDGTDIPTAGLRYGRSADPFPIDIFLPVDAAYEGVAARTTTRPWGPKGEVLPFLACEDLVAFKVSFGRAKDWVDLAAICAVQADLDIDAVATFLLDVRGPTMHPRIARLRAMHRASLLS